MSEPVNILLVDDNPANLDVLVAILASPDYRMVRARSAQEALLALLRDDFAVIVLDIQMPEVGGIELAHLIKQRKRSRDIPILFLTAYDVEPQDILRGYGAGAVDYLTKPVHTEILRFKISVFVELYRNARALADSNQALSKEMAERQRIQKELREANEALERRVEQRTAELAQAAENERAARAEAERQSKMKEDFLAIVSHELRTPLNAIYGWTKILAKDSSNLEVLAKGLGIIDRNARAQAQLIEDLLDMSSIASGKARLDMFDVRLMDVIDTAVHAIRPAADAAGLILDTKWTPSLERMRDCVVRGDSGRLQQVIGNLLSNAVTFTPAGGRITVHGAWLGDQAEVEVSDSGIGIAEAFLPHMFDKFRQADHSSTRRHRGLGLGLSIVKSLVELHGGRVKAASAGLGRGASFTISLPVAGRLMRGPTGTSPWLAKASTRESSAEDPINLEGLRVLAVDDEQDAREMLFQLLRQFHASVSTAASAAEALDLLGRESFDLLISDIGMPGDDGYALIRALRQREGDRSRLAAIACTAFARHDDRHRSLHEGFDEHVSKPVDPAVLIAAVVRLINGSRGTGAPAAPANRRASR